MRARDKASRLRGGSGVLVTIRRMRIQPYSCPKGQLPVRKNILCRGPDHSELCCGWPHVNTKAVPCCVETGADLIVPRIISLVFQDIPGSQSVSPGMAYAGISN